MTFKMVAICLTKKRRRDTCHLPHAMAPYQSTELTLMGTVPHDASNYASFATNYNGNQL